MKKVLALLLIAAGVALTACSATEVADLNGQAAVETTGLGSENVKLIRAKSFIHTKYGMSQYDRSFEIRVKNLSYEKEVGVRHQLTNGTWTNIPASYFTSTADGYEIWKTANSSYYGSQMGSEYVVYATQNGQTSWDNNGGQNYSLLNGDGVQLGSGVGVLQSSFSYYSGRAYFYLDVANIAYNKEVKIVYTTDNWNSSDVVYAYYNSGYAYGYAYVQSPNQAGFERWSASVAVSDANNFQYFIEYNANGQVYYDNNYGANYKLY
jgi:hypothetical protein